MEFVKVGKKARKNQYGSQYVKYDGKVFDSNREAHRYVTLKKKQEDGLITGLECQKKFILVDGFRDRHGEFHRPITYSPDFCYWENGIHVAEDVKSEATVRDDVWMVKKKLFLWKFGSEYDFRIVG